MSCQNRCQKTRPSMYCKILQHCFLRVYFVRTEITDVLKICSELDNVSEKLNLCFSFKNTATPPISNTKVDTLSYLVQNARFQQVKMPKSMQPGSRMKLFDTVSIISRWLLHCCYLSKNPISLATKYQFPSSGDG